MRHLGLAFLAACTGDTGGAFEDVPVTEEWTIPELGTGATVVRVEGSIPHIYAANREDLARAAGFVQARDRYFEMEMARRLGLGELSTLLGDAALGTDMETRGNGSTWIADRIDAEMAPETRALYEAFAEGVNAYVAAVLAEDLPPPSEFELAAGLLGRESPLDLMSEWDTRAVAGVTATILYNLGFEGGDVGRQGTEDALDALFTGAAFEDARRAGAREDLWERVEPVYAVSSAPGWGSSGSARHRSASASGAPKAPPALVAMVEARNARGQRRMGHDWVDGFGSNAWAVAGSASSDGRALFAGDGHLPLSVPSLFWQVGLHDVDPRDPLDQVGMTIPGMPVMAVGTNGYVAWGQTQLMGDITDWYVEEVRLDANGEPVESLFQGEWKPLQRFEETYVVADVPLLDSVGRTETWARWVTFDGRWIAGIEGRPASATTEPGDGEAVVAMRGDFAIPDDIDEDGRIAAISFDYVGLDLVDLMRPVEGFGTAKSVGDLRLATRGLLAYSQNIVAADRDGSILYTGYQAVPCRAYLPRGGDGAWVPGADPNLLLDGTIYPGFTIPLRADGRVDESQGDDPTRCVVPFDAYPQSVDPASGYVLTANNDPGAITTDGSLTNDPWYIGGPWIEGYRAKRIDDVLHAAVEDGTADVAAMQALQADHQSVLAEQLQFALMEALLQARLAHDAGTVGDTPAGRLAALYGADKAAYVEVESRLAAWEEAGHLARSGVETFYDPLLDGDAEAAVATTIFNAWVGWYVRRVFDDEGLPGVWQPTGATGRLRGLTLILAGRGADNPQGLASWIPETEESAFFDVLGTPEVETSHEIAMLALADALASLRGPETDPGHGGFGTNDMSRWLWGEKHWVHFDSLLADQLGDDPTYAILTERFAITTEVIPLPGKFAEWPGFPRHGDHLNVDAGNSGLDGTGFSYGSGPVFRMVVALGPDGIEGHNILPGGQSGLTDSDHFADQAELWLGNQTWPMRLTTDEVVEGATHREALSP